ncbi:hypothetical protein ES708_03002 [subsurface metagenome]
MQIDKNLGGKKKMDNGYKEEIAKLLKKTDEIDFQIRVLMDKNAKATAENNKNIEALGDDLKKVEFDLQDTLKKSGEEAIKPKCGWAHFKAMKDKIVIKNESETIKEIEKKLPSFADLLIKYVETYSIRKDKLNQLVKDETIRIEVLETVTVESQDKKFEYKFTG